jgi:hypothetical protein
MPPNHWSGEAAGDSFPLKRSLFVPSNHENILGFAAALWDVGNCRVGWSRSPAMKHLIADRTKKEQQFYTRRRPVWPVLLPASERVIEQAEKSRCFREAGSARGVHGFPSSLPAVNRILGTPNERRALTAGVLNQSLWALWLCLIPRVGPSHLHRATLA